MSSSPSPAARRLDLIAHNQAQTLRVIGEFVSDAWAATKGARFALKIVGLASAPETLGTGLLVFCATVVLEFAIGKAIDWAADKLGEALDEPGIMGIKKGSNNVSIIRRPAARGSDEHGDPLKCHEDKKLVQGSQWVTINRIPLSRVEDWTNDSGKVATGSGNVFCGGPKTSADTESELQKFVKYSFYALNIAKGFRNGAAEAAKEGSESALKGATKEGGEEIGKSTADTVLDKTWDWISKTPAPE